MNMVTEAVKKNLDLTVNKPLKLAVYEAFKKTIILGEIPAGERINEKEFSEVMNISRTPIRYALRTLTDEQLVEHIQGVGVLVKGITLKDAHEIYDIRKSLDTLAIITAMKRMSEEEFDELEALLSYGEQLNQQNRVDEVLQNFSDFNSFIYEKSQMLRLKEIVTELQAYLIYFRDIAIRSKERRDQALHEHWLIFRSMCLKDEERIQLIVHEHLDRSLSFIIKEMERRKIG